MWLKCERVENIVGKGENAGNQHFLLFAQSFSTQSKTVIITLGAFNLSTAKALNLVQSKKLSFGKELKGENSFNLDNYNIWPACKTRNRLKTVKCHQYFFFLIQNTTPSTDNRCAPRIVSPQPKTAER